MRNSLLAVFLIGCGGSSIDLVAAAQPTVEEHHSVTPTISVEVVPMPDVVADVTAEVVEPAKLDAPYAADIRSVRMVKGTVLYKTPSIDAERVGVIRKGALAGFQSAAPAGAGCDARWIQLVPRGWACETMLEPSTDAAPAAVTALPVLADLIAAEDTSPTPPVRGVYGVVRGKDIRAYASASDAAAGNGRVLIGKNTVRSAGAVTVNGKKFWQTSQGDLIDSSSIRRFSPSKFYGVAVTDAALPAWVRSHRDPKEPIETRATASAHGKITGELAARTVVTIVAESADGRFVRIGDDTWVAREDLRVATMTIPPEGTGDTERWFDVDLDEQILVAYEGIRPVYATLVSTGKRKHRTPTRITRIASKLERAHMISDKDEVYSVADVPWTMYYDRSFALHTSYWHDGFGAPRSHGCINLAPRDARLLYRWSSPDVPPGWSAVYGDADNPGSLVRVRSSKTPEPAFGGYARAMREQRPPVTISLSE